MLVLQWEEDCKPWDILTYLLWKKTEQASKNKCELANNHEVSLPSPNVHPKRWRSSVYTYSSNANRKSRNVDMASKFFLQCETWQGSYAVWQSKTSKICQMPSQHSFICTGEKKKRKHTNMLSTKLLFNAITWESAHGLTKSETNPVQSWLKAPAHGWLLVQLLVELFTTPTCDRKFDITKLR